MKEIKVFFSENKKESVQFKEAGPRNRGQWRNSEKVTESEYGGQRNKFGRGRNLLRPLGANPIYSSREEIWKLCGPPRNSNLAWGIPPETATLLFPKLSNNWQLAALSDASSGGKYENVTGQNGFSTLHFLPDMMVITITKYCNCGQDDCHDDGEDKTNDAGHSVLDQGFSYTLWHFLKKTFQGLS